MTLSTPTTGSATQGAPRAKLTQNVVGLDGSGPMPFLKGFWFFNVEGIRGRNGIDPNGSSITHKYNAFSDRC